MGMQGSETPQVLLEDICKSYGGRAVLQRANLSIAAGEFAVVIGRSGSGKSTLLRLIGGLESPDGGRVRLAGQDIAALSESERARLRRRSLGFVFQFFNLIPTLTVAENIELPLALNNLPKHDIAQRVADLLLELGLTDCAARFPEEISGGEQQRVAIARAVAHEPSLVLADEPTGNLDLETAGRVLELLESTCRRRGATLVMATHGREVVGLADRVLSIRSARLEETEP
jgi:putative ABC transport system ATP-binding protein